MVKMLIVDDEIEICEFLKSFFEDRGYKVCTAHSGREALEVIGQEKPSIILLDIKMPGQDGLQVLKEVKQMYPQIKVIMVSAIETEEKVKEAIRLGADSYITKPLSLEYLETDVKAKLSKLL